MEREAAAGAGLAVPIVGVNHATGVDEEGSNGALGDGACRGPGALGNWLALLLAGASFSDWITDDDE